MADDETPESVHLRIRREAGGLLLVDAVPAAGKMKLDFALCDYMVLSAHKLGGPTGVGAYGLLVNLGGSQQSPIAPPNTTK